MVSKIFGNRSDAPDVFGKPFASFSFGDASYELGGLPVLLAFALIVAYFVILGQTGGTVFQRLFGYEARHILALVKNKNGRVGSSEVRSGSIATLPAAAWRGS